MKIYSVQIHTKPGRKVRTFWYTDEEMAKKFIESVKVHPKVLDCMMLTISANVTASFDENVEDELVMPVIIK